MRRLLVTGGAGFLGANFVHYWVEAHPHDKVNVLDALTYAGNRANLAVVASRIRFVRGNVCDTPLIYALLCEESIDTIVHFAAESHVDRSIASPDAFVHANVVGTFSLLKAAHTAWVVERRCTQHRFHQVSTDEVYGSCHQSEHPYTEMAAYSPNSPYAATKAAADHLVRAYHQTYGLKVSISRCSNNYGPFQFPEKLIPRMCVNILQGRPLPVYGDGLYQRGWLHVSDHSRAVDLILSKACNGEVYNIGAADTCNNLSLVRQLCSVADHTFRVMPELAQTFPQAAPAQGFPSECLIRFVEDRPGHDRCYAIDGSKIHRDLGFLPVGRLENGLQTTFDWYVAHHSWWRELLTFSP